MPDFRVLSVQGRSVRVVIGVATVDLKVEDTHVPGRYFVRKPAGMFLEPEIFRGLIGDVVRAYKESLEKP